ncbi:hypothetical protein HY572_01895 [Candidatus Micrarchaeota archaeon]|nr:hypothetical protein [Candidatus Micrarchaeota archaeon]
MGKGRTTILGQRVLLGPVEILVPATQLAIDQPLEGAKIYEKVRTTFNEGWSEAVRKMYGIKSQDYFKFLIDMSNLGGWGDGKLIEFEPATLEGKFINYNTAMAEYFKGKTSRPVDHIWRGLAAGGLTKAFKTEIDWFETKCIACGEDRCEYIFKPRKKFEENRIKEIEYQIPI